MKANVNVFSGTVNEMPIPDMFELELNKTITIDDYTVTRVPGGWLYRFTDFNNYTSEAGFAKSANISAVTFVPYQSYADTQKQLQESKMVNLLIEKETKK